MFSDNKNRILYLSQWRVLKMLIKSDNSTTIKQKSKRQQTPNNNNNNKYGDCFV